MFIVLVKWKCWRLDLIVFKQSAGKTSVFTGNLIHLPEHFYSTGGKISQISDRGCYKVENRHELG